MESKKFALLLDDIETSTTNVGKVEILSCYVAQRFRVDQITQLVKSITRASSRLKVLKLLSEEMESCDLQGALTLIEVVSMNTANKEIQFSCIEELVKYRKLNVSESENPSLFTLFVGTEFQDKVSYLLSKTRKPSTKHSVPAHNSSMPSLVPLTTTSVYSSPNTASLYPSSLMPTPPTHQPYNSVPSPVPYPHPPPIPPAYHNGGGIAMANPIGFIMQPSNNVYPSQLQQKSQTPSQTDMPPGVGFTV